jgi:DNA-binding PadR family transcriptional regulator
MFGYHKHRMHGRDCGPRGRGGWGEWGFGGGGREWGGWGERHGGGRRRMFDGGELKLILLALLEEQPRHGYDLIREIEERTGGAYAPSPGVVYPTLTMLDELGHIDEVKEEGARKRFAITDAGRAHLAERREEVDALLARLADMGEQSSRGDRAPLKRSIASLFMALRQAMAEGDSDRAHAIVDILDDATRKIERL